MIDLIFTYIFVHNILYLSSLSLLRDVDQMTGCRGDSDHNLHQPWRTDHNSTADEVRLTDRQQTAESAGRRKNSYHGITSENEAKGGGECYELLSLRRESALLNGVDQFSERVQQKIAEAKVASLQPLLPSDVEFQTAAFATSAAQNGFQVEIHESFDCLNETAKR